MLQHITAISTFHAAKSGKFDGLMLKPREILDAGRILSCPVASHGPCRGQVPH